MRTPKTHHEPVTGHRRGSKTESGPNTVSTDMEMVKVQTRLFVSPNYTVVQAQTGTTATLHCEVTEIGESTVRTLIIKVSKTILKIFSNRLFSMV